MTVQIKAIEQHFAGLSVLVRYCHEVKGLSTVLRNTLVNLRRCIQKVQEVRVPLLPPQRRYPTETKLNKKTKQKGLLVTISECLVFNPLTPNINMNILLSVLHIFLMVLVGRIQVHLLTSLCTFT